ncbi:hypothetical protein GCM10028826_11340 [Mucilaginibacter boryungensis]
MEAGSFVFNTKTIIQTDAGGQRAVKFLSDFLLNNWKFKTKVIARLQKATHNTVAINTRGATHLPAEGYRLHIAPSGITLTANGAGLFYGLQTLIQLFPNNVKGIAALPCLTIEDSPRFAYRGLMLDVSRHFFTISEIKDLLDLMAYYKLNRFHWHLTDDQGWRLEIKSYPKLTQIGAWRVPRITGFSSNTIPPQPGEKATDGGFYTQQEVREIIRYAGERHIEVMPEIDVPGHSMAAIASYPELCVTRDTSIKVSPGSSFAKWFPNGTYEMYIDNTLNPTDERVYQFLDKVFGEVAALFPYEYIHIGGDECFKGFWEKDAGVQAFMKKMGIKTTHELQSYFISRLNTIIQSKHKKLIGWDEIMNGGGNENVAVMNRFGEKGAIEQVKRKQDIILAPGNNGLYFDYAQSASDMEPSSHGGYSPLWKAYNYNPDYTDLTTADRTHILGVEACVWTEHIPSVAKLQYMLLPRLLALAETGWAKQSNKSYQRFVANALPIHLERFDKTGINYRVPTVFNYTDTVIVTNNYQLNVTSPIPGAKIFFTFNNNIPGDADIEYKGPVTIHIPTGKKIILKTIVITPAGRRSVVTRTVLDNTKAVDGVK